MSTHTHKRLCGSGILRKCLRCESNTRIYIYAFTRFIVTVSYTCEHLFRISTISRLSLWNSKMQNLSEYLIITISSHPFRNIRKNWNIKYIREYTQRRRERKSEWKREWMKRPRKLKVGINIDFLSVTLSISEDTSPHSALNNFVVIVSLASI